MEPIVDSLFIYPLKSAGGIQVQSMEIGLKGPKWDRHWMLCDSNGRFLSQRTHPQMSQIKTQIHGETLLLEYENQTPLEVPLNPENTSLRDVKIFSKWTQALLLGKEYDLWFRSIFNQDIHLVCSPPGTTRETSGNHGPLTPISFPDGYPFLLINQASLDVLNTKLEAPVSLMRFRPNIVIRNLDADQEDQFNKLKINDVHFEAVKACSRCSIIDVDPSNGKTSKHVTQALKKYRIKDGEILFGQNLSHSNFGSISVGQKLKLEHS